MKRYREEWDADYDTEDEEYTPSPPRKQKRAPGGQDKAAAAAARAAAKAAAAEERREAQATRQRAQLFLKSAGPEMHDGMNWYCQGRPFSFALPIDPAAFKWLFGDGGEEVEAAAGKSGKRTKPLRKMQLDADGALNVFGKTRCTRKYRLGSVGGIDSIAVTYDERLQRATLACNWSVDRW